AVHREVFRDAGGAAGARDGRVALPVGAAARPPGRGGAGPGAAPEVRLADDRTRTSAGRCGGDAVGGGATGRIEGGGLGGRCGEVVAVDDVSLRVPDGSILALLGPNGAGKTTIVRLLTGVLALTAGRAAVAGYDVGRDPAAVRARVGLVTDVPGLHEQMTVASYLDFFGSIYGVAREARRRRIDELLDLFELGTGRKARL